MGEAALETGAGIGRGGLAVGVFGSSALQPNLQAGDAIHAWTICEGIPQERSRLKVGSEGYSGMMKVISIVVGIACASVVGAQEKILDLENLEPFNGAVLHLKEGVLQSKPQLGAGDRGAFLKGVEFTEGTIEVKLRGSSQPASSFLGVVFRAKDGKSYEAVYFRPFNFGHGDQVRRGHAVQYMCHPEWPWRKLRQTRAEEFENPAKPEPKGDEWFRAKVEVADGRVKVFVNESSKPCLDVGSLGKLEKGKVGIWFNGVASFSDLKITPKK